MCFGYTRSALMMVRAQPEPRNSVPCTCCTQSDLDVAAEYHHPLEDSVICDLHPFDLTFPYVAPIKEINQVIQPHWDPFALLSIQSSWQSQANYALSQSIESVPEMPYDSSISREYCREYGSSPSQGSYELQEAILSTQHPMAGSLANKHHNLTPNRPLAGGYVHDQNSYCVMGGEPRNSIPGRLGQLFPATSGLNQEVYETQSAEESELVAATTSETGSHNIYAVLGRGGGRSHGKIRVRRPPGVRWNETMQCAYISPITDYRCKVRLNRGPDLERHLRTVHLRQEAQAVTDGLISRDQAKLLPASWKIGDRLDFGCPHCLVRFTRRDARNRHIKMKHGKDSSLPND